MQKIMWSKITPPDDFPDIGEIPASVQNVGDYSVWLNKDGFMYYDHKNHTFGGNMAEQEQDPGYVITGTNRLFAGVGTPTAGHHQVKIDKVANGFVIEIGCKKFVGENWEVLAKKLGEYWKDPVAAEKKYCK